MGDWDTTTREGLRRSIKENTGYLIPDKSVCGPHHHSPMEYVWRAFHNQEDLVVWAPRGGGKTCLGALVTMLDLIHKPGCAIRILGGSMEQSLRMWEHLVPMVERAAPRKIDGKIKAQKLRLKNGSSVAVLAQSQTAVRGQRVQKLRCDEVELFDEKIWNAVQLVSRSKLSAEGKNIKASLEALSTMHNAYGLMQNVVDGAKKAGRQLVHWCLLDVLEKCPQQRDCETCELQQDCDGKLKNDKVEGGFVQIDDAIRMKQRVDPEDWKSEMLCLRPSRNCCVFKNFSEEKHVCERDWWNGDHSRLRRTLAVDFGFRDPFVCLWILSDAAGRVYVFDEMFKTGQILSKNVEEVKSRHNGSFREVACDPAGKSTNSQTSYSDVEVLQSEGFKVLCKRSLIREGLEEIRVALESATGEIKLRIHPRCKTLIQSMARYHYDPKKRGEDPLKDGENDHCIDALRYFYINPPPGPTRGFIY